MTFDLKRLVQRVLAVLLVAGGSGWLVRGQAPQETGTWAPTGALADNRANAASAPLPDGRTLIAGGYLDGAPTASIVVLNPVDHSFVPAATMTAARVGHTATVLADGRVLISGGLVDGQPTADLEIVNLAEGTSVVVGAMAVPRSGHAAAFLQDDTVLLVGGTDGAAALASGEIFHVDSNATTSLNDMSVGRVGLSATTLIDGRVLVAGGSDGTQDLATAEIFNPWSESFEPVSSGLSLARSGHTATLLPNNAGVLIAGGSTNGVPQIASDLFLPAIFTDPYTYAQGQFVSTGPLTSPRTGAVSGPAAENLAFIAGGASLNQEGQSGIAGHAERYRFASIKTDKNDYAPGERAVITGSGWQPNEEVNLLFQEDPAVHDDYTLTVTADGEGNILWDQWAPELHDLDVRFYLTAQDSRSRAQTTFTDAWGATWSVSLAGGAPYTGAGGTSSSNGTPVTVNPGGTISASITTTDAGMGQPQLWRATSWRIATTAGTFTGCLDTPDANTSPHTVTISMTAPATAGTFNVYLLAHRNVDCSPPQQQNFTLTGAVIVDAAAPTVTTVSATAADGAYSTGAVIPVQVVFSEPVAVTGTPALSLATGTPLTTPVSYSSGSGTSTLTFNYIVAAGNSSGDLDYSANTALALSGGTIKDLAGNAAGITLPAPGAAGSLGANKNIAIDTSVPGVTSINRASASPTNAAAVSWTVTFNESVGGVDAADFALAGAGLTGTPGITNVNGSGTTYTVTASTGNGSGSLGLDLVDNDSIQDGASNKLGGTGAANGNFTGQVYTVDRTLTPAITAASKVYDGDTTATILTRTFTSALPVTELVTVTGGTATFDTKNVGTAKTVTATGLSLAGADAAKYVLGSTTATTTADITARPLTVTATGVDKVYDGNVNATVTLATDKIAADVVTAAYASATFADKHVGTAKVIAVNGISVTGADAGNYALSSTSASASANITPRSLTVTATGVSRPYDGTTAATVALATDAIAGDIVTGHFTSASFADKHVGTGKTISVNGITIAGVDAGNYALANTTAAATADITARTLTVTAIGVSRVYDGSTAASVTLSDDRVAGDVLTLGFAAATFADKTAAAAKLITVSGVGITGGADAGNYVLAATTATATADITARPLTVSATGISRVYDGGTAASVTLDTDKVAGDAVTGAYASAAFADKHVATGKTITVSGISIAGGDAANYSLTNTTATALADITPRPLAVTASGVGKEYDGTTVASVTLATDRIPADDVTAAFVSASFDTKDVGTGKAIAVDGISISGTDAGNYTLSNTTATASADITPRALTITASTQTKTYGETFTFAGTEFTTAGLVSGDAVASVSLNSAGAAAAAAVGTHPITASGASGTGLVNYAITYVEGTLTVTARALTITASGQAKTYGTAFTFAGTEFTSAGLVNGDEVSSVTLTSAGAAAAATVGSYAIAASHASGTGLGNYTISYVDGAFTVEAKALTVSASNQSKTYGETFTFTGTEFTSSGLVNGDEVASVTLTSAGTAAAGTVGSHPIAAANAVGTGLTNYAIAYVDGVFTVNAKPLTITAANQSKTYGETFTFTGAEFTPAGLVNGDTVVSVTLTSGGAAATAAVGSHAIASANAVGTGLANYAIAYVDGAFTVNAKALTITATNQSKTYGNTLTFAGTEFTSSGLTNGDTVATVSLTSPGAAAGALVGTHAIDVSAATGTGLTNYAITYVSGSLAVNARTLTITANSLTRVYGQPAAFTGAEFTTGAGQLVNGDSVTSVTLTSAGAAATATVIPPGPSYAITPSAAVGTGLENYDLQYADGLLTRTPRTLTVTATGIDKPYDGTTTATVTLTDDRINADVLTLNRTAAFTDPNAGIGKPVNVTGISLSGPAAGNYTLAATSTATTATITPAATATTALDVTANYNEFNQTVQLIATVAATGAPAVNQGKVKFTVTDPANGNAVVGAPVEMNVTVGGGGAAGIGGATQTFVVPGLTGVGTYKLTAEFSNASNYANSAHDPVLRIVPGFFTTDTANMDADFRQIDGFDVLFGKGSSNSVLELKNTNPGTMHYRLTLDNTTGVAINASNDNTARAVIEVPSMTSCGGVPCPAAANPGLSTLPAWVLKGRKSVRVRPDDQTDDLPLDFRYKASGACTLNPADYSTTLPADAAPRCIMVSGFALPRRHKARLDINFEFRWKKTDGWSASPDAKLLFRSGFAFKSTVALTWLTPVPTTRLGYYSVGLVGAGQKVSAVGGFAFDNAGAALAGYKVRLFNNTADTVAVAEDTTTTDGFYFIWKKSANQANVAAADLPSGVKYVVRLYDPSGALVATRTMSDKLGAKEFDEEDFHVTP